MRPTVVVIRGAFAAPDQYWGLEREVPEFDWRFCDLPFLSAVDDYIRHFDRLCAEIGGPVLVCGVSLGGVFALALSAPNIVSVAALDPPMRPDLAWPIREAFRARLTLETRGMLASCFGVYEDGDKAVDHLLLLERGKGPAYVLCGHVPLEPERPFDVMPSLVDEASFAALRSHPRVWIKRVVGVGHNIADGAASLITGMIRDMWTLNGHTLTKTM